MSSLFHYKISNYAYYKSTKDIDINMDDSILEIGSYAYADIKNLKCTKLSNNLKNIKEFAFSNSALEEITLPSSLKTIGAKAFSGCKHLKKIVIPDGVTKIGLAAFAECEELEEVYLPNSLTSLSAQMFLNCKKLKKVHLPQGITHLPDEFFKGCMELNIDLDHITSIGKGVFNKCASLNSIPSSIKEFHGYDFKGCKSLEEAHIPAHITHLPDHLFDGCVNLRKVIIDTPVSLGSKTFKNCISLKSIPDNIKEYGKYAFENCLGLESITLGSNHIPEGCFRGCKNLREIKDFHKVLYIDSYGLDNTGFTSLDLTNLRSISNNILSNCKKLTSVKLDGQTQIGDYAFYRSPHLKVTIPSTVNKIGKMAFAFNKDTKVLNIPSCVEDIQNGAFAYSNYERIVCNNNQKYFSFNDKILIKIFNEEVLLYACGSKDKSFNLNDYSEQGDLISPLNVIAAYAFAGAKYLEELGVPSCVEGIEKTAFLDAKKLKTMNVITIPITSLIHLTIKKNGYPYFDPSEFDTTKKKEQSFIPFETVNFYGDSINISASSFAYFDNLKNINFINNNQIYIDNNTFYKTLVNYVKFPDTIKSIGVNAFNEDCVTEFSNGLTIKIKQFMKDTSLVYKYNLYILVDDSYLIEGNGKIISLDEKTMKKYTKNYDLIANNPTKFMDYYYSLIDFDLEDEELLRNGILMKLNIDNRRKFLKYYDKKDSFLKEFFKSSGFLDNDDDYTYKILDNEDGIDKFYQYVDCLKKYNIKDKILYSRLLIYFHEIKDLDFIFYNNKDLLLDIITKFSIIKADGKFNNNILSNGKLVKFMNYIIKYNIKDPFIIQPIIIGIADLNIADKFFETFDNNTKRLLKNAQVLDDKRMDNSIQNLTDLLTLCYITGGLEVDERVRQRALTFITEKIILDNDNGNKNYYQVVGDDLHRMFNFGKSLRDEFDLEFAVFFLENYRKLYQKEISKSGFIERAYTNFREISKTSTADSGSQRHKKVTMNKVTHYLAAHKFNNVDKTQVKLAEFVGEWYDSEDAWDRCKQLVEEVKKAPRNIFTKYTLDEDGNKVFDNSKSLDLREMGTNDFAYEWLPKDDWNNFILGKHCNCCAHLLGAGNGIMRASIITDNVQNLVIRNRLGEIVAKSTLYVNRESGYGVFNNVEASLKLTSDDLKNIYEAFMRGTKQFMKVYNENNEVPIHSITIGCGRNRINDELEKNGCKITDKPYTGMSFKYYSFNNMGYNGDWMGSQRLVLSKGDIE